MPGWKKSISYRTVPDFVIDAKLRAEGALQTSFPELRALESPLVIFAEVVRIADIAEVIRKLSDKGVETIGELLERTVEEARDEFGLDEDEMRTLMSALILLWWRSYQQKLRVEAIRGRSIHKPVCHCCGDWGRAIVFRIDGTHASLAAVTARYGTEALFAIAGRPDVEVIRVACSCRFGQELYKRNMPIL